MTLTVGTSPFGHSPAGTFTVPMPDLAGLMYFEPSPRRISGRLGGETVVDSKRVRMLHEHGHLPLYYFPEEDIRADLLEPSDHTTTCPHKGEASYWHVRVGERLAENAVWSYLSPIESAVALAGFRAFHWDALDEWFEEDEPAIVHARDPYHRVDAIRSSRHVRISVDGVQLADTGRAVALFETSLPTRWYIPLDDIAQDLLVPSDSRTGCAYKGFAGYWSVRVGEVIEEDLIWTYRDPRPEAAPVKGLGAFFNERVDLELDGEPQERPRTHWSAPRRRPAS